MTPKERFDKVDVRNAVDRTGALALLDRLGIKYRRHGRYAVHLCPVHGERNPSASTFDGQRGIGGKCHSCGTTWDAFRLVQHVHGCDFVEALDWLAERYFVNPSRRDDWRPPPPPAPPPERPYPPQEGVAALWAGAVPVTEHEAAMAYLEGRGFDPYLIEDRDLLRAIGPSQTLPSWASYKGQSWRDTGHLLVARTFDANGAWRSLRAWRIVDNSTPKRLPPGGYRMSGLVLADGCGVALLQGRVDGFPPDLRIVISEGEPDWVTWATRSSDADEEAPVCFGINSGAWTRAHADRVPDGSRVIIRTDPDQAGDRYALAVAATFEGRKITMFRAKAERRSAA